MHRIWKWLLGLVGGALFGAGLVLQAQVALAHHARAEVDNTFFLWRELGRATFAFQSRDSKLALAMAELPPEVLDQFDLWSKVLGGLGLLLALAVPWLRTGKSR